MRCISAAPMGSRTVRIILSAIVAADRAFPARSLTWVVSAPRTMNLQSLVVVVLRLMALDFLLRVAVQLTPQLLQFLRFYERSPLDGSSSSTALPLLVLGGLIVSAVLLWVLALPIARFVTRGVSQELTFGAMSLADCYAIAFMGVGLFYIASHLPSVLSWTHYLFKAAASTPGGAWKEQVSWYEVAQAFVPFIVGVVLFVNGRRWAVALARRQTESSAPATTVSEKHEADT